MKNLIKITLLAVVVIAIIGIALFYFSGVKGSKTGPIAPQTLVSKVERRVNEEIVGKSYSEASKGYDSILDEIQTECFVRLSDGSRAVSVEDETTCRRKAFDVYCKIYIDYADSIFKQNSWNESVLHSIKDRGQQLLDTRFAEKGTEFDNNLNKYVKVVNDYFAAWKVVKSANNCTSISSVENIKQSASHYLQDSLLTNNTSLKAGLNQAFQNAKDSYARYINSYCNGVASKYKSYGSYVQWTAAFEDAKNRISSYENKFGKNAILSNALKSLKSADDNALGYYN